MELLIGWVNYNSPELIALKTMAILYRDIIVPKFRGIRLLTLKTINVTTRTQITAEVYTIISEAI